MRGSRPASRKRFSIWWTLRHCGCRSAAWRPPSARAASAWSPAASRRADDDVRVAHQPPRSRRGRPRPSIHEGEVQLSALDETSAAVVRRLRQLHRDVRPGVRELAQEAQSNPCAHALVGADAGVPAESAKAAMSACAACRRRRPRVAEEQLARLRQRDAPRAAGALDQLLADDALEHLDLLADRRLRVAELLGGTPNEPSSATAWRAARCRSSTPSHPSVRMIEMNDNSTCAY